MNSGRIGVCRLENAQVKQTMTGSTVTLDILENIGGSGNSTTASAGASVATPGADKSNSSTESGTGVAWEVKQVQVAKLEIKVLSKVRCTLSADLIADSFSTCMQRTHTPLMHTTLTSNHNSTNYQSGPRQCAPSKPRYRRNRHHHEQNERSAFRCAIHTLNQSSTKPNARSHTKTSRESKHSHDVRSKPLANKSDSNSGSIERPE